MCQAEGYRNMLKLSCRPLDVTSGTNLLAFIFWLYSINWPSFILWLPLLREKLGNMCIATVC